MPSYVTRLIYVLKGLDLGSVPAEVILIQVNVSNLRISEHSSLLRSDI